MLLEREVSIWQEDWVVEIFGPAHYGSGVALHFGECRLFHDQGGKNGVLINNNRAPATEPFEQLNPSRLTFLLMN